MRIDFFHVDLLPKSSIKGVSDVYSNCGVHTDFNPNKQFKTTKKGKQEDHKYYNDILKELYKDNLAKDDLLDENIQFISEDDLFNLKQSIESNKYNINTKALLISLIKYTERI